MKNLVLIIAILFTTSIQAAETSGKTKVEYIYSRTDSGKPYIKLGPGSMPGCASSEGGGYLSLTDEKGAERTYSLLLTALISKREVRVYYKLNSVSEGYSGWGLCTIEAADIQ